MTFEEKKKLDEVMEEYDREHNIPIDVTGSITHSEFVEGVRDGSVGFSVRGQAISLVKGARAVIFNILVLLYLIAPALLVSAWAYHEQNWWLLLGIIVASLIAPRLAQRKGHIIGAFLLMATVGFWYTKGLHNYYTFFSLCGLWGYTFFQMAESAQNEYAMQSLVEDPELFARAVAQERIRVLRKRDAGKTRPRAPAER